MFSAPTNPYDEPVVAATDEKLTDTDWSAAITISDKVLVDGEAGARNCVAAIQKRIVHRNANVQLRALELTNTVAQNSGEVARKEISSKSYTDLLRRVALDVNTHEHVKRQILTMLEDWKTEYPSTMGLCEDLLYELRNKGLKFTKAAPAAGEGLEEREARRYEEELKEALEASVREKERLERWVDADSLGRRTGASGSGSGSGADGYAPRAEGSSGIPATRPQQPQRRPPSPPMPTTSISTTTLPPSLQPNRPTSAAGPAPSSQPAPARQASLPAAVATSNEPPRLSESARATLTTRVRAKYDYLDGKPGELTYKKGDVIKVIEALYEDWWRGEVGGRTGIFPVIYVEPIPDPTPTQIAQEAEMEAKVFASAGRIDKLVQMLEELDAEGDNLGENDELSELYQECLSLRPKIVKLLDKYNQKTTELLTIHEKFRGAKKNYDKMIETSLAKYNPDAPVAQYTQLQPQYDQANQAWATQYAQQAQPYPAGYYDYSQQQQQPSGQAYQGQYAGYQAYQYPQQGAAYYAPPAQQQQQPTTNVASPAPTGAQPQTYDPNQPQHPPQTYDPNQQPQQPSGYPAYPTSGGNQQQPYTYANQPAGGQQYDQAQLQAMWANYYAQQGQQPQQVEASQGRSEVQGPGAPPTEQQGSAPSGQSQQYPQHPAPDGQAQQIQQYPQTPGASSAAAAGAAANSVSSPDRPLPVPPPGAAPGPPSAYVQTQHQQPPQLPVLDFGENARQGSGDENHNQIQAQGVTQPLHIRKTHSSQGAPPDQGAQHGQPAPAQGGQYYGYGGHQTAPAPAAPAQ